MVRHRNRLANEDFEKWLKKKREKLDDVENKISQDEPKHKEAKETKMNDEEEKEMIAIDKRRVDLKDPYVKKNDNTEILEERITKEKTLKETYLDNKNETDEKADEVVHNDETKLREIIKDREDLMARIKLRKI